MNYYQLEKDIDNLWQKGIKDDGTHLFFNDIQKTQEVINKFRNQIAEQYNIKSFPTTIQDCQSSFLKNYPSSNN